MEKILASMIGNLIIQLAQAQTAIEGLSQEKAELEKAIALIKGPREVTKNASS